MSKVVNSYHKQAKKYSKSQIPPAFFSNHSIDSKPLNEGSGFIHQIALEFAEKINNLQSQIDNLRLDFNTQLQSLYSNNSKKDNSAEIVLIPQKEKVFLPCCFDNSNHNHNFNLNLYNANIINKVKRSELNSISNKSFGTPKKGLVRNKERLKLTSNLNKKHERNKESLMNYFSIRNEEKEKIKNLMIAIPETKRSLDCTQIDKSYQMAKAVTEHNNSNSAIHMKQADHSLLRSVHFNDTEFNKASNKKIQVISTVIIHNETLSFRDKIKLMYLNKEIRRNNNLSTLLNESCPVIYRRIEDLSINRRINLLPSAEAAASLNLLSESADSYFKEKLMKINNDLALDLFTVIYLLLGNSLSPNEQFTPSHLYDNLMTSYNINSFKDLLIHCLITNFNSSPDAYAVETKQLTVNLFKKHPLLISSHTNIQDLPDYKHLTYISPIFNEINLMFQEDIKRNAEIVKWQQELLSFKDLLQQAKRSKR